VVAETKLSGAMRAPAAVVNRVGPGHAIAGAHAVADDHALGLPFHDPRIPQPLPEPPTAPPPTEQEHREQLASAIEALQRAEAALATAADTHARAIARVEERRAACDAFAALETEAMEAELESIRLGQGVELSPDLRLRLAQREQARVDLDRAMTAAETLLYELILMRGQADAAGKRVNMLASSVLSHVADRLADEHSEHLRQAALRKETLFEYDHFSAGFGAMLLSGKVQSILVADGGAALARIRNTSAWRAARDKLLTDPRAEVSIEHAPSNPVVTIIPEMSEEERRAVLANLPSQRGSA
jgi:hypothetical protein